MTTTQLKQILTAFETRHPEVDVIFRFYIEGVEFERKLSGAVLQVEAERTVVVLL